MSIEKINLRLNTQLYVKWNMEGVLAGRGVGRGLRAAITATFLALVACLSWIAPVQSATVTSVRLSPESATFLIEIEGEISAADVEKFRREALLHDEAIVLLNSPGGAVVPAISIAKIIRLKGYPTVVSDEYPCNSSCALIWLAGSKRYLGANAKVGFHAAYSRVGDRENESGVANALVGNFLASLNLPERAIIFATSAPPDRLQYLTLANAQANGVEVLQFGGGNESADISEVHAESPGDEDTFAYSEAGKWKIMVDRTLGNGCFAFRSYNIGQAIRFGYDARDGLKTMLLFFGYDWKSIEESKIYKANIKIDNFSPWDVNFVGMEMSGLKSLKVSFDDEGFAFLKEFSKGKRLTLTYDGSVISNLELTDVDEAMAELVDCQLKQPINKDPFAK